MIRPDHGLQFLEIGRHFVARFHQLIGVEDHVRSDEHHQLGPAPAVTLGAE